ncbi:MAG: cob(I)yrinic acid a,c-diamide adenosyltransferase [Gammaproteobacteria bacterium]|nr:cob(I)yrinic acid a,c-diamide adenosyltransferase [Gammaproteobacteria bacterium]
MIGKHSKIYTRKGDNGNTSLANGQRVEKNSARMEAIGSVDELNSLIGVLAAMQIPDNFKAILLEIQHQLFHIGSGLAMPNKSMLGADAVAGLEVLIDHLDTALPPLTRFILPGGAPAAAGCHNARSVCRRVERNLLSMQQAEGDSSDDTALQYLNRLSDFLFVLARTLSRLDGGEEIFWQS